MSAESILPTAVGIAGVAGGLGVGARLTKHLIDTFRDRAESADAAKVKRVRPVANVPVEVSPEEAAEMEAKGVKVRRIMKQAWAGEEAAKGLGAGLLTVGAAGGAYMGADKLINYFKDRAAKAKLEKARNRVAGLLSDEPGIEDIAMHGAMKTAAEHHFKTAGLGVVGGLADAIDYVAPPVFPVVGAGLGLAGLAAYHAAKKNNKWKEKLDELKRARENAREVTPEAAVEPVVMVDSKEA